MYRYDVLERIGAGGMGTVYRALDRLTGEQVALKRIEWLHGSSLAVSADDAFFRKLTHEFSVLAGLRHPHIITVLDYGFEAGRRPFFTMELLRAAKTIVQATRTAPNERRLVLLVAVLQALAYLHRRGILHRDLKPANVLVSGDTVRLLDFGLAALGASSGELVGTLGWMAPEMLRDQRYLPQSDLYAVGALAVEMFTGHPPYPPHDVLTMMHQPPDLDGLTDERLRAVVRRLLKPDPAARFPTPEAVIEALGVQVDEPPVIRESYLQTAPFIGREAELGQLQEALATAMAGHGDALLVGGESGVGKSRLLSELRIHALTAGALVFIGQATQGRPYHLWREPLRHLIIDQPLSDLEAGILKAVLPAIDRAVPTAPPLSGAAAAQRLAYTIVSLIQRQAQPVVLLLEDLHLAGESLAVVETISRAAAHLPLLVIGSYRGDETPDLPQHLPAMRPMILERFTRRQIEQLCTAMIGPAGDNPELVGRLHQESEGNVFFLIETLRTVAEQVGGLARVGQAPLPPTLLPAGVGQIARRRLRQVPDWARPVLNLAAIAGQELDLDSLAAAYTIDMDYWLYVCGSMLAVRDNQWHFAHDKLREALVQMLAPTEKAALHRRLATAIETRYPDDEAQAPRLADHWSGAGDKERALHYAVEAGQYLRRIGDFATLRRLTKRGLESLQPHDDEERRARLLWYFGDACRYSDVEAAQDAYHQALILCDRHGWDGMAAGIRRGLAVIYRDQGQMEQAQHLIDQSLEQARRQDDAAALIPALTLKARSVLMRGDYQGAAAYYQEALALAHAWQQDIQAPMLLMNLGAVACMQGHFEQGQAYFEAAEQAAEAVGAIDIVVYSLLNRANLAADRADFPTAEADFERCIPMIEALGEFSLLAGAYGDRGDLALRQGKLDEAASWYQRGGELAARLHNHRHLCHVQLGLGKVAYARRDFGSARQHIQHSLGYARDLDMVPEQAINLGYLARIELKLGQRRAARAALREGLQRATTVDDNQARLEIMLAALGWMLYVERPRRAAELYGLLQQHPESSSSFDEALDEYYCQLERDLEAPELAAALERGHRLGLVETLEVVGTELS